MTTCFPAADIGEDSRSPSHTRLANGRYSMACCIPANSRPGTGSSRHAVAPVAITTASYRARSSAAPTSRPTAVDVRNFVPSARICSSRRSRCRFSILNSGMPYRISPPSRSSFSYTTTVWPARVNCCAAASPVGPDPITATVRPESRSGGCGGANPSSQARSAMAHSTFLIVTAGWLMASTQPASQGAGHNRPVNSGKLLVACSRSAAARQSSRETRSFHSGIRLPSGHASWQNGIPQSIQRSACLLMMGSNAPGTYTSSQSRTRSSTGRMGPFLARRGQETLRIGHGRLPQIRV